MDPRQHHEEFLRLFAWARPQNCRTCSEVVIDEDFRDRLAVAVFDHEGMCQKCQDHVWPPVTEEDVAAMAEEEGEHEAHQPSCR